MQERSGWSQSRTVARNLGQGGVWAVLAQHSCDELNVLFNQCLDRDIGQKEIFRNEAIAWKTATISGWLPPAGSSLLKMPISS